MPLDFALMKKILKNNSSLRRRYYSDWNLCQLEMREGKIFRSESLDFVKDRVMVVEPAAATQRSSMLLPRKVTFMVRLLPLTFFFLGS